MNINRTIYSTEKTEFDPVYTPDIVFAKRETGDLTLQIVSPIGLRMPAPPHKKTPLDQRFEDWHKDDEKPHFQPQDDRVFPLIVNVPGSGWQGADGHSGVLKLAEFARHGFVCASISYRGTYKDDTRFPAAVQDTKEAIRFLRANAAMFRVDPERVALLGDSSGGHTVAMAALTGSEEKFNIGAHLDQPTDVKACCIFYGPNDMLHLVEDRVAEHKKLRPGEGDYPFEAWEMYQDDFLADPQNMLAQASPINYIASDKKLPSFLFMQGDEDAIIPMAQGLRFCDRVRECGGRAEFIKLAGAGHGNGCWGRESVAQVIRFFEAYVL